MSAWRQGDIDDLARKHCKAPGRNWKAPEKHRKVLSRHLEAPGTLQETQDLEQRLCGY